MIVKTKNGYQVTSEHGKPLSKDNLSREDAEKRLRQIEYFKHAVRERIRRRPEENS